MQIVLQIDWQSVFVPSLNLFEIILRGTLVYLFLFVILRVLRREAGAIGISDLLVVVLIADAAQNAMASEYRSITEGVILVATIAFWDYFLDWLSFHFPGIRPLLRPPPLPLIKDGRLQRQNMRKELITLEELMGQLREQGVDRVEDVKTCCLEGDGTVSVIKQEEKDSKDDTGGKREKRLP